MKSFKRRHSLAIYVGLLLCLGCKVEQAPAREQTRDAQLAQSGDTPKPLPTPNVDDAQLVVKACGHPDSDRMYGLYDKIHWGTVRRITYTSMAGEVVQIDFTPSLPGPAPDRNVQPNSTTNPTNMPPPQLPSNAVWRFDDAHVGHEDILTANRLDRSLPCAAGALRREY